ncbi:MAG TPA: aminodeoxychorismate/anthranilate synthase component II [Candidatus Saccharimonadales bacterium]|nr:aminodeoxychorismate/anthranilate synthase component II [Candidatus Saccharimonadales bacterium]
MKILILDNFDSFVYNISQLVGFLNALPVVIRNNQIDIKGIRKINPDAIVISPGPGHPKYKKDFGICRDVITKLGPSIPILGICLGHQGLVHAFGGKVIRAGEIRHGKTSNIEFNEDSKLFEGVKNPFVATRYHSLIADKSTFPKCLRITSTSLDDGEIMSARHEKYPIEGIQFHPESILTTEGKKILLNFIQMVKR